MTDDADDAVVANGDADGVDSAPDPAEDDTVPTVELELYELTVRLSGRSDDDLTDVEETSKRLLDYLVRNAQHLEDHPDDRGLG